jgi:hypothetical protein
MHELVVNHDFSVRRAVKTESARAMDFELKNTELRRVVDVLKQSNVQLEHTARNAATSEKAQRQAASDCRDELDTVRQLLADARIRVNDYVRKAEMYRKRAERATVKDALTSQREEGKICFNEL